VIFVDLVRITFCVVAACVIAAFVWVSWVSVRSSHKDD